MDWSAITIAALGGGTLGAGLAKIIDRIVAHKFARKDKREDCADDHEKRIADLEAADKRRDRTEQAMLRALYALLAHSITGNETGAMRMAQDKLVEFIIDKD